MLVPVLLLFICGLCGAEFNWEDLTASVKMQCAGVASASVAQAQSTEGWGRKGRLTEQGGTAPVVLSALAVVWVSVWSFVSLAIREWGVLWRQWAQCQQGGSIQHFSEMHVCILCVAEMCVYSGVECNF